MLHIHHEVLDLSLQNEPIRPATPRYVDTHAKSPSSLIDSNGLLASDIVFRSLDPAMQCPFEGGALFHTTHAAVLHLHCYLKFDKVTHTWYPLETAYMNGSNVANPCARMRAMPHHHICPFSICGFDCQRLEALSKEMHIFLHLLAGHGFTHQCGKVISTPFHAVFHTLLDSRNSTATSLSRFLSKRSHWMETNLLIRVLASSHERLTPKIVSPSFYLSDLATPDPLCQFAGPTIHPILEPAESDVIWLTFSMRPSMRSESLLETNRTRQLEHQSLFRVK